MNKPKYRYYLYNELGEHSFHTPIDKSETDFYENLEKKDIGELITEGADTGNLLSMQFVDKVFRLLHSGKYSLAFAEHAEPLPKLSDNDVSWLLTQEDKKDEEAYKAPDHEINTIRLYDGPEYSLYEFVLRFSK